MPAIRVAFQGESGAYSEAAALSFFTIPIETVPCHSFEDTFAAVANEVCSNAVLPIENSLAGSIHRNYDLLLKNDLHIVGEYHYRVQHCLMGLPGSQLSDIHRVYSHPQALAQCEQHLKDRAIEAVVEADTAGSARMLHQLGDIHAAALASARAAEVYGLQILAENMEDNSANFTRFLVLAKKPLDARQPIDADYKTTIVFSLINSPGVLFKALSVFALRDIDLTKIESRPIAGQPWEYIFYIDFAGYASNPVCRRALDHLGELAPFLRILGSYPRHRVKYPTD